MLSPADQETSVIIVGGGPVGLALAGDLGWRGINCVLVEQSDGTIGQPKMDGVNVRTMEFCRRWGIADQVKNCAYPQDYPQDMVYLTSFSGYELGREAFATPSGGAEERNLAASPEVRARCPQNLFDPILQRFAASLDPVDVRYRTRFIGFEQSADRVVAEIEDVASGQRKRIAAPYLVGCDGAASAVRSQLGIQMKGSGLLTYTTNVIFRCADLVALHDKLLGYRHIFIGPEGTWATIVAINGRDEWRLSIIGDDKPRELSREEIEAVIRRAIGTKAQFEVLSTVPWMRRELVAERYSDGRVFLAGDSAHLVSPTGGFGMNTGIGDAVDLSWKLEGALRGWAGPQLLASYDLERRPVGLRASKEASGNLLRTLSPGANPDLLERSRKGAMLRYAVGRKYSATMLREWYKLGIDLGYVYSGSPVVWPQDGAKTARNRIQNLSPSAVRELHKLMVHLAEGTKVDAGWQELPAEEVMRYEQSAAPGARAPHAWIEPGRSTLDLFGKRFTLLRLSKEAPAAAPLEAAAARAGLPLSVAACGDDVAALYGARLALVRPDGHVAWRGDDWPAEGAAALVDRVRGASARAEAKSPQMAK